VSLIKEIPDPARALRVPEHLPVIPMKLILVEPLGKINDELINS
jgi:hypothetical protein